MMWQTKKLEKAWKHHPYALNHGRVSGQSGGQSSGAVDGVIKPANFLLQHGLEAHFPQTTGQQLPRFSKGISLKHSIRAQAQLVRMSQ